MGKAWKTIYIHKDDYFRIIIMTLSLLKYTVRKHARKKGILKNGKRWFPNPKGKLCGEVWHITSERHKNKINGKVKEMGHATPKPLDMVERIITASSNEGDLVVDFFVGTGTTALASKKLKRNFICSDRDEKYVKLSKTRLDNHE